MDINKNDMEKDSRDLRNMSKKGLLLETVRLFLQLLWVILRRIIRIIFKSIRFFVLFIKLCVESTIEWWNDKSTQEKVSEIKRKTRIGAQKSWKYTKIYATRFARFCVKVLTHLRHYSILAGKAIIAAVIWTAVNTVQLIIHMRPTVIRMWNATKHGAKAFAAWTKRVRRGTRLRKLRRKRRYAEFKRNGGFKKMLYDTSRSLKSSIQTYMEEDQEEAAPDAITEDNLIEEKFNEMEQENKAHIIGKKLFTSVKNIVETDE